MPPSGIASVADTACCDILPAMPASFPVSPPACVWPCCCASEYTGLLRAHHLTTTLRADPLAQAAGPAFNAVVAVAAATGYRAGDSRLPPGALRFRVRCALCVVSSAGYAFVGVCNISPSAGA